MPQTRVAFHALTFVPEGADVMIGRPDTDSYALFPADGAELLRTLYEGTPPEEAKVRYESTYGETVDLDDFLATVTELGFVREAGDDASGATEPAVPAELRFQGFARAVFSAPAWCCYLALLAGAVAALVSEPVLRPGPENMFFTDTLLLVQLVVIGSQLPALALHEGFHALAGRRLGLPFRFSVSVRMYFIVFETQLRGLLGRPRRQRYLPFMAGTVADLLWYSALVLLALSTVSGGRLPWYGHLALAAAYPTLLRLIWQCYLVLRTDFYYVLATALGCSDLHAATQARLRNTLWRLMRRPHGQVDMEQWSDRDQLVSRWYAPFAAAMTVALFALGIGLALPVATKLFSLIFAQLGEGQLLDPRFWDSLASLLLAIGPLLLAGYVAVRNRKRARRVRAARLTPLTAGDLP